MIAEQFRNDFRTVFLLHDKRFFWLFAMDRFTDRCLSKRDTEFLRSHIVETFLPGCDPAIFQDARIHKDRYILKHARLGKSEKVYAGACASKASGRSFLLRMSLEI